MKRILEGLIAIGCLIVIGCLRSRQRPSYPFDATDVPGDYVLNGDGWWDPHP